MGIDIQGLMDRCAALEKEALLALATPVTADAVPYFRHIQEATPYFTNRLDAFTIEGDSEDYDEVAPVVVVIRLIIGHVTEGYVGESDARLHLYIPQILEYFNKRELLQSAAYPTALDHLVLARITSCTGYREFQNSGVGGSQVGCEFRLEAQFIYRIEQAYT